MIHVHIITEDRTGGGLDDVIRACVQAHRAREGKEPLRFPRFKGNVDGASQLLKECEKYEFFRFKYAPRFDHVFFVLDARNAWKLPQLRIRAPERPFDTSLQPFIQGIKEGMERIARGSNGEKQWASISQGFHPHVLVWERETLILPVADKLGLREAVPDACNDRQAYETVSQQFWAARQMKYPKSIHGPQLLGTIAKDAALRAIVLDSNPSLRAIVEEMASL